ncbi:MAG: hypothetical protein C4516_04300 [Oxalobacter sp.]|nr:MAG: hypothetical protein C4516_04300 [Oxalobacter sp.]
MKRIVLPIAVVVLALLSGCDIGPAKPVKPDAEKKPLQIPIPPNTKPEIAKKIEQASATLNAYCPEIWKYLPDLNVQPAKYERDADIYSERREFGWKDFVEAKVIVADQTRVVPTTYRAGGHTCYFRMSNNELTVSKKPCVKICNGGNDAAIEAGFIYEGSWFFSESRPGIPNAVRTYCKLTRQC